MGKASRKLAKKQQENKNGEHQKKISEIKRRIGECKQQAKYEDGLLLVAELMDMKCQDIDVIFDAAELYFMAGDYQRANIWIEKTLEFSPGHIGARILLAHICLLGDRVDTGLDILEVVLKLAQHTLTAEQEADVKEMLLYYKKLKGESELNSSYPNTAKFLGLSVQVDTTPVIEDAEEDDSCTAVDAKMQITDQQDEVKKVKQEIKDKPISLQEKISLYNSFAGAYYYENQLDSSKEMLVEANALDEYNEETLRNLALLSAEIDDKEAALKYASKLQHTDFSLLKLIKN